AGAAICAVTLLWPPRRRDDFQREAARAVRAVADLVDANGEAAAARARAAVDALGRQLLGTPYRPTRPIRATAPLPSLPDELDWLLSFLTPFPELVCAEEAEALAAAAAVLRASADRLEGRDSQPDFERLEAARDPIAHALVRRLSELPVDTNSGQVP